jgi:hypothetical protein
MVTARSKATHSEGRQARIVRCLNNACKLRSRSLDNPFKDVLPDNNGQSVQIVPVYLGFAPELSAGIYNFLRLNPRFFIIPGRFFCPSCITCIAIRDTNYAASVPTGALRKVRRFRTFRLFTIPCCGCIFPDTSHASAAYRIEGGKQSCFVRRRLEKKAIEREWMSWRICAIARYCVT